MARLYTLEEAAEALGITPDLLREWIADGRARATRRAGDYVLREHEVLKLQGKEPPPEAPPAPPRSTPTLTQDRRRSPGRRQSDQVSLTTVAGQLEQALERAMAPISRVQVRMLERLEEMREGGGPAADRLARLEEGLAKLAAADTKALETEIAALKAKLAEAESRARSPELAAELETLQRTSEEALRALRAELAQVRRSLDEEAVRRSATEAELERVRKASEAEIERLKSAGPSHETRNALAERDRATRELAALRAERERLVDELAGTRTDRERLMRAEAEERSERERLVRERDDLRAALDRATQGGISAGKLEIERDAAVKERDSMRADRDRALTEAAALRAERDRLSAERRTQGGELTELVRRLEVLRSPLDAAGAKPTELAERAARVLEESRGQRQHLEARLRTAEKEVLDLRAEVDRLKALEAKGLPAEGLVEGLRAELQTLRARNEELEGSLKEARAALEAEAARAKAEREKLMANFEEERRRDTEKGDLKEKQYRDLEKTLLKLEGERTRLLQKEKSLEDELAAMRGEVKGAATLKERFEGERSKLQEQASKLQGQVNSLQRELDAAQRNVAEEKAAHARLQGERDSAQEKARELSEQLKALSYKISVAGSEKGVAESREMVNTIARLQADTAEKDMLIQEGHRERAELREELEKTQRALYELQQRSDRERKEWSEILAREIKQREALQQQPAAEEDPRSRGSGWRLFKPRGGIG